MISHKILNDESVLADTPGVDITGSETPIKGKIGSLTDARQ